MKTNMRIITLLLANIFSVTVLAVGFDAISNTDATAGLRQALTQGAEFAVSKLGQKDGFYGNPKTRIPLPGVLQKSAGMLRAAGMGGKLDELEVTMNQAAEAAVVEAKPILVNAVQQMSVTDAKEILTGGNTAGTEYFRRTASDQLTTKLLPIIKKYTDKLGVSAQYNALAQPAAGFGLIKQKQASLDTYVTEKTLDGLFAMVAEEEQAIRKNPVGQSSALLQKVFGTLKH